MKRSAWPLVCGVYGRVRRCGARISPGPRPSPAVTRAEITAAVYDHSELAESELAPRPGRCPRSHEEGPHQSPHAPKVPARLPAAQGLSARMAIPARTAGCSPWARLRSGFSTTRTEPASSGRGTCLPRRREFRWFAGYFTNGGEAGIEERARRPHPLLRSPSGPRRTRSAPRSTHRGWPAACASGRAQSLVEVRAGSPERRPPRPDRDRAVPAWPLPALPRGGAPGQRSGAREA